ncbi:xanthine dehydrogenase family protein subunit M [Domibacillus sp. A3M-37]|uniref:FAD binding domain-containing protein n=1 Tax=Domibacillus sp. A3M-37 TaxID=2962037 RepID=UPI0020B6772C|nr:xanthine dehydrogenase family protein subunit M [Domibacillus sp. A3M-37]MCP3761100.1 xanthine dehydrogenase family protein subunit M [Domibacillus sp. A3M-37]
MKPPKFEYYKPATLEEALNLLEEAGDDGKIIAGGQSLVPIMNMRLASPKCLIDINGLEELSYIKNEDNTLKIGTLTRQSDVEQSEMVANVCGLLAEAITQIGHVQTRNRGTIGGSIVHADPSAELPLALLTLNGSVQITSKDEVRTVAAEDFFITYLTTDIMPTEVLTEVTIPLMEEKSGYSFQEIARRHGDFALVAAACHMTVDDEGLITAVRLALGGVEAIPLLIGDAEDILTGEQLSDLLMEQVTESVEMESDPESDLHASSEYRMHLAKVLTKRVLTQAYERARG